MIQGAEELAIAQERLRELQARIEQIVSDPHKSRRAKEMELAGVRSMMMQIEREIREYNLSEIQRTIQSLQGELESSEGTVDLLVVVSKTLNVLEEVTQILLQPTVAVKSGEP
jgi:hypothetical protein